MRTLRGPSRSLKSLHRVVSTSDVPFVACRHTRVGIRCPPDVLSGITLLADGDGEFTCEPEDFCFALPVRARRASARERLPSCREPASDEPAGHTHGILLGNPCTRAPFRRLPIRAPRQAVLRTSSWLAPSRTNRPCDLPVEKTRDASSRCLPPNRITCTRTSRVPGSLSQLSLRGHPTETKAPPGITGGPDVSRRP